MKNNKFELIKKSRPKLKIGDLFYYKINNSTYVGVIIQNQKYMDVDTNGEINCCLFLENRYKSIEEISIDVIKNDILKNNLILPPININKKGWTNGFFIVFSNLDLSFANNELQEIRIIYSEYDIYDINYSEKGDVPNYKLAGKTGIFSDAGVELLLQMSLDLDFAVENPEWYNPYKYYDDLMETFPAFEPPFWYYKAKKRLNK